eukprot:8465906-Pyramimonas_sp.AAC.1
MAAIKRKQETETEEKSLTPEQKFWTNIKDNGFDFDARGYKGNPVAGRFQRYLKANPAKHDEYQSAQGPDAKRAFRPTWAKQQHDKVVISKSYTESEILEEFRGSVYRPLGRIAVEEGGGAQGMKNA